MYGSDGPGGDSGVPGGGSGGPGGDSGGPEGLIRSALGALGAPYKDLTIWDNYKDYTYVGTLDGLYQHTLIATGTISFFLKMRLDEAHLSITLPDLPIEKKGPTCSKN